MRGIDLLCPLESLNIKESNPVEVNTEAINAVVEELKKAILVQTVDGDDEDIDETEEI